MKIFRFGILSGWLATMVACGASGPETPGGDEGTGEVFIALTSVPAMVACIKTQVTMNGSTLPPVLTPVTAGASSATVNLGRLPTGTATFSGGAYSQACTDPAFASAVPSWISDTVMATLTLGTASTINLSFHPNNPVTVSANFLKNVSSLAAGPRSTYAVMADGTVKAWGITGAGIGTLLAPTDLPGATAVAEVAVSTSFACLRTTAGAVQCWGIVPGAMVSSPTPAAVVLPGTALRIAAGTSHICAIVQLSGTNNPVYCWGSNTSGQLGNGTNTASNTPVQVLLPAGDTSAFAIAAGGETTCALTTGAHVMCWGNGTAGQLGNGQTVNQNRPQLTLGPAGFQQIAVGGDTAYALRLDGQVFGWGIDPGDGADAQRLFAVPLAGVTDAVSVATGNSHGCAVRRNGAVVCWGAASSGQIAVLTADAQFAPTTVNGLPIGAAKVEAHDGNHTCALLQDGSVMCWGANEFGQLGDGTIAPRFVPTRVKMN